MKILIDDWIGASAPPDVTEPVPSAPVGSYALYKNGSAHQIFLKTANVDRFGWTIENYDQKIFNVIDFGAVGDNATDCRAAFNAAIAAAQAAGGGIIYVPPGQYAIQKPNLATQDLLQVANVQNITFMGDGKASQIRQFGNQFATSSVLFRMHNFTRGIRFLNLFIDAAEATNIEATNQNHMVQIQGAIVDAAGSGTTDVDVIGCYFGQSHGDMIRLAGDTGVVTSNSTLLFNSMDGHDPLGNRGSRSAFGFQRGVTKVDITGNYMTGIFNGQLIDFEPSGTAQCTDMTIMSNQMDHNSQGSQAFTLGGTAGSPSSRIVVAYNTIVHGGAMTGILVDRHVIIGNVVNVDSPTTTTSCFATQDLQSNLHVVANCFIISDATLSRIPMSLIATSTNPFDCTIMDNVVRGASCGVVGNGAGFLDCQGASQLVSVGNIWTGPITQPTSTGVKYRSGSLGATTHVTFSHDLVVPDSVTATQTSSMQIGASNADNLSDVSINNCLIKNPGNNTVVEWLPSGGALFTGWRYCGDNLCVGGTTATVAPPTSNVGLTGIGTAGPGSQVVIVATTPVANVSAPAGSIALNQAGGVSATMFLKETGVGVSGGTGGWLAVGAKELTFGCADVTNITTTKFLATGSDLALASTTTIELVITRACAIRNWRVSQKAGTGTGTITYTVRKNNVAQSGNIVINFTATVGGPTGNSTFVPGDTLSIICIKSQAPTTNPTNVTFTLDMAA